MEEPLTFKVDGRTVSAVLTAAGRGDRAVVLCHGFLSSKNSSTNKALTRFLTERGIATLRFDFLGQGESEGPFEDLTVSGAVNQALAAIGLVEARGYRRIGLMGSSFGGLVAILAAGRHPSLAAVGLKCPAPDFHEVLRLEFKEADFEHWETHGEIPDITGGPRPLRLRYAFLDDCLKNDAYKAAASITAPVLVVQGDCDEYLPLTQSRKLVSAVKTEKHLEILTGADHSFSKAEDFVKMTTLLGEWFTKHL